ncbi:MAG: sulfatase-like hydrolase/transferase, partial [Pseudomonadales bacterium]
MKKAVFATLVSFSVFVPLSGCSSVLAHEAGAEVVSDLRPNIVLILADDLGYGHVSAYGGRVPTPNIDALARDGILFTNSHTTAPNCAPSRAGMLTGRSQNEFGYEFNPGQQEGDTAGRGIPLDVPTLQEVLSDAGYRTGLIGKWHQGQSAEQVPNARGFDYFYGFYEALSGYITDPQPGDEWVRDADHLHFDGDRPNFKIRRDGVPVRESRYLTDAFSEEAAAFVAEDLTEPFFLYLSYNAPHAPLEATKAYLDRVTWTENRRERVYDAMVLAIDDGVGQLVQELKARGIYDNTIVMFASDNGCPIRPNVHPACSNAPFGGSKGSLWDGGTRVPMIIKGVGDMQRDARSDILFSFTDIMPTFLSSAGITSQPEMSGVDLTPWLLGTRSEDPRSWIAWRSGPNVAIKTRDWKLYLAAKAGSDEEDAVTPGDEGGAASPEQLRLRGLNAAERISRTPLYGVAEPEFGWHVMLYDLNLDPGEQVNVASENPERVAALRRILDEWVATLPSEPLWGPQTLR